MKNTFISRSHNKKKWHWWLAFVIVSIILTLVIVAGMDLFLKGEVTADYLITGLVASVLVASIVVGLTINYHRLLAHLHQDHDYLDSIIKVCPVPMALNNDEHQTLMLNPEFTRKFGYTLEDIPTIEDWQKQAYPDPEYRQWVADTWRAHQQDMKSNGTAFEPLEAKICCKDRTTKTVMATATPLGNAYKGMHLIALYDITERTKTENELWLTKTVIDMSKTAFYRFSPEGKVQYVNDFACQSLGYTRDELVGMYFWDFNSSFPATAWPDLWKRLYSDEVVNIESDHKRKDGTIFSVDVTGHHIYHNGEEFNFVFAQEITERKMIEADLRVAAIAFESQEGIFITDAKGVILKVNQAFTNITGYSADEAIGQKARMLKSGRHDEAFYAEMYESINRLGFWRGEIWNNLKSGKVCPEYMNITAVTDNYGLVTNYVATLTDISEYKQAEVQRRANETRLRDVLVREVHHRIKNNLQGVTGVLRNFVAQHPKFGVQITYAISQVESIAVIHGLQGRVAQTCVRLCELTNEIACNNESLWKTAISVDIPKDWIPFLIAETETVPLALVLNELIANAIKHSDSAKGINIALRHEPLPNMIQITITNPGRLPPDFDFSNATNGTGLQLVASLLPKKGASLFWEQCGDNVAVQLEVAPPIITMEQNNMVNHDEP